MWIASSGLPLSLKRCDSEPLAKNATFASLAAIACLSASPKRRLSSSECHMHQPAIDTTLKC